MVDEAVGGSAVSSIGGSGTWATVDPGDGDAAGSGPGAGGSGLPPPGDGPGSAASDADRSGLAGPAAAVAAPSGVRADDSSAGETVVGTDAVGIADVAADTVDGGLDDPVEGEADGRIDADDAAPTAGAVRES